MITNGGFYNVVTNQLKCFKCFFCQQNHNPYKDVVSNLEEVSGHIAKAERSSTACMDGILKANIAVDDTVMDPDLQCVALVKKAELVFIAVSVLGYFDEVRSMCK